MAVEAVGLCSQLVLSSSRREPQRAAALIAAAEHFVVLEASRAKALRIVNAVTEAYMGLDRSSNPAQIEHEERWEIVVHTVTVDRLVIGGQTGRFAIAA